MKTDILFGIWLILAPFILGYASLQVAMWNDILLGVLVLALARERDGKHVALRAGLH